MELLYVWINEYKCLHQQGINLSPEYNFELVDKDGIKELRGGKTNGINVFKNTVISNITAIVGGNGAGKTTFLDYLTGLQSIPKDKGNDSKYEQFANNKYQKKMNVIILKQNNIIQIYTNIDPKKLNIELNNIEKNVYYLYQHSILSQTIYSRDEGFLDFSKIYITNSGYGTEQGSGSHIGLDNLYLTPNYLSTIATTYFDRVYGTEKEKDLSIQYVTYCKLLKQYKQISGFQQLCDIQYYLKLIKSNLFNSYCGLTKTELWINVLSIVDIAEELELTNRTGNSSFEFSNIQKIIQKYCQSEELKNSIIYRLKLNYVVEAIMYLGEKKIDLSDVNLEITFRKLNRLFKEDIYINDRYRGYFINAENEITRLTTMMNEGKKPNNVLPSSDLAYKTGIIFTTDEEENIRNSSYLKILEFLDECIHNGTNVEILGGSFILRYLTIQNYGMSSGERAFQNIMSWLALVPEIARLSGKAEYRLKKNILLCIDEIDLYCHPTWQRDFMKTLIQEIENEYKGYNVQIVVATHSPLCLSDFPRENIIYVRKDEFNSSSVVSRKPEDKQTFGMNLYEILNDSFHLGYQTIGGFAGLYIKKLIKEIDQINNEWSIEEYREYSRKINIIGDPLIKAKLQMLLGEKKPDKLKQIERLKSEKAQIEAELNRLQGELNDKDQV